MEPDEIDEDVLFQRKRTPEEIADEWREALNEVGISAVELADFMKKNGGDYRPYATILRGIQRMLSGETRVSGEMYVIATMLLRQHRRLKARHPALEWVHHPTGSYSAKVDDWVVWLSPQTKGRWVVSCQDPKGSSPPFGRWQQGLETAKNKALFCVEEGMNEFAYNVAEYEKYERTAK